MKVDVLEFDGKSYCFVKKVNVGDVCYCFFTNKDDKTDLCIRKLVQIENEYNLIGLDDEKELLFALQHYED